MKDRVFYFVQDRWEEARKAWASSGGRLDGLKLAFWQLLYNAQKLPQKEGGRWKLKQR